MSLSLVIPLWNEEQNIDALVESIAKSELPKMNGFELILVNNGSEDKTADLINQKATKHPWIRPLQLPTNRNYGGGIQAGIETSSNNYIAMIPGDLQVSPEDVSKVWGIACEFIEKGQKEFLVKGYRTERFDGFSMRLVSRVYTLLANTILNIHTKDLNALPKIFSKSLYNKIDGEKMSTFTFDAQLLLTARINNISVTEVPVTFYARREGVSSWSSKRMSVYIQSFKTLVRLRRRARNGAKQ